MPKKILIMAGGTGGHVIPALAIANKLLKEGHSVEWLGTNRGIESRLVPNAGIKLNTISVEGVRGKGRLALLKAPFMLLKSIYEAFKVFQSVKPDLVIGLGGFASGPGGVVAKLRAVPLVVHEQNAMAGTTNKILSRLANRVYTAFPDALPGLHVGNPVHERIAALAEPQPIAPGRLKLVVLGGSLGAQALNEGVPKALKQLPDGLTVDVFHQAGRDKAHTTRELYQALEVDAEVVEFVDDMVAVYQQADLIICRAGALTVSEVACAGCAAIFVPFPFAIDDHQTANARWLVEQGAGLLVPQDEFSPEFMAMELGSLLGDREKIYNMKKNAYNMAIRDASDRILQDLREMSYV